MSLKLEAQHLIIQLLNEELRRSNRLATKLYHKEIADAKANFIEFINFPKKSSR
jgi:hypothetical protein